MSLRAWMTRTVVAAALVALPATTAATATAANAPATNFDSENHTQNVYLPGTDGSLKEISWVAGSGWGPS